MAHQSSRNVANVTSLSPEPRSIQPDIKDPDDLTPSDSQPPGVDMDLEEALTSL